MKQYLDLLQNILDNGVEKESGRANMPNTYGLSFGNIKMDLSKGFPLLTTKKMFWKGIVHELLWFLRGDTNIKYLVDNNVNIWNGDSYRWYLKHYEEQYGDSARKSGVKPLSQEKFIEVIKEQNTFVPHPDTGYKLGDLGKVYGYQWRNQNEVDQLKDVIDGLRDNPYSRYHIIDGWNKADFPEMALPPCHLLYHFIVRPLTWRERVDYWFHVKKPNRDVVDAWDEDSKEKQLEYFKNYIPEFYLDLNMYQRSCDTLLGVPFNIASMSLLLKIIAKASNMIPGISNWIGGDTHLYVDHIDQVKEQLTRNPLALPELKINKELNSLDDILSLSIDDFELVNYRSHDKIKAELFTGLKK